MFIYKHYELIEDKYFIEYWYNRNDSCYAKIFYFESLNPKIHLKIGMIITYYEAEIMSVNEKAHWTADCYLEPEHMNKKLIDKIGTELLERTSCKEPFVLNVYKGNVADGDFRIYGDVYRKE